MQHFLPSRGGPRISESRGRRLHQEGCRSRLLDEGQSPHCGVVRSDEPSEVAPDFPLVQILKSKVKEFKGIDPEDRGIPCLRLPVSYQLCRYAADYDRPKAGLLHGFDEWVDLEEFFDTIKIVALTIAEWCGVEA